MLDANGSGGYAGTNWAGMSMIDMWLTIGNQDTSPHWQLLSGWRKSYELTLQHMAAVRNYRENLAAVWPPEKNAAAAAYIARLDDLLDHLQQTYDAAVANYDAFSGATSALSAARREMEPVVNEYIANQGKIAEYERELASPPPVGEDAIAPPVTNPVAAGRQEALEAKARSIMSGLSAELVTARAQLRQPKPYNSDAVENAPGGGENQGVYVPPPIPSVVPFVPESPPGSSAASSGAHPNVAATPGASSQPGAATRLPGLVLGGTQPPVVAPPAPSPINPPSVGAPPLVPGGPVPPIALPSPGGRSGGPGRVGSPGPGRFPTSSTISPTIPPGGVIGARPSPGGTPPPAVRTPANVNPVGGIIAPQAQGKPTTPGARSSVQPMGAVGARPQPDEEASSDMRKWDPDNPWATAKGVDPVVLPPEEPKIDPGPAIGLS